MSTTNDSDGSFILGDKSHSYYNDVDADVVLRSSDGMTFGVHAIVLKLASDVFAGMVNIPQGQGWKRNAETVQLSEDADIICALLDSIYPRRKAPALDSFSFVSHLAVAADKYDISDVTDRIREGITSSSAPLLGSSLERYALASRFGWENEAKHTSQSTTSPNTEISKERAILESIDTMPLMRLFSLHRRRHSALASLPISFQTTMAEEVRLRSLRWEHLSYEHSVSCRSQHHNKTAWAAFKMVALSQLEKVAPVDYISGCRSWLLSDHRLAGLWEDKCTKCSENFFQKIAFSIEFERVLHILPMAID